MFVLNLNGVLYSSIVQTEDYGIWTQLNRGKQPNVSQKPKEYNYTESKSSE